MSGSGARIVTRWDTTPDAHWWPVCIAAVNWGTACELCSTFVEPDQVAAMMLDGGAGTPLATFLCVRCAPDRNRALLLGTALTTAHRDG
jgi:hypothetical protein